MTATIIALPSRMERDEYEFDHKGSSNYTRAVHEAYALWEASKNKANRKALAPRLYAFDAAVSHLASYRTDLPLLGLVEGHPVELRALPALLLSMAGLTRRAARARCKGAEVRHLFPAVAAA